MRKFIALLLALVMVCSLTAVASAQALEPVTLKIWFHGSNVTPDASGSQRLPGLEAQCDPGSHLGHLGRL